MSRLLTFVTAAGFLLLGGCDEPRDDPKLSETGPPAQPETRSSSSERVDLHGRWERLDDTPERQKAAIERLAHLPSLGFGREASARDIEALDIDVMPDGTGLPAGSGTVERGETLFAMQCVQCHGADGRGGDYEALVGREPREGFPFAHDPDTIITVGNYWPYATTLFDYIRRAMPQAVPGSLPPDDVYSLVAYVLYLNELVPEETALDQDSLPNVLMPARDRFVYDDREGGTELR